MKKSLLSLTVLITLLLVVSTGYVKSQVLYEGFDYTVPGYIGGNGNAGSSSNNWTTHSVTSGQTTTIDLYSGSLSYTGLNPSVGNKVLIFGNANATSRDVNRAFTSTASILYFSALINIVDNSQLTTNGDYFMNFGATSGTTVSILGARLGAKSVNAGANFRFMIQNISGGTPTFTEFAQDMNFGTTYLVVVKYDRSTSPTTATLWVNPPTLGGAEPSTGSVSNNSGTSTFATFGSICLRNNQYTPKSEIDEIYVGETYASVTPGADVTPPVATFTPANSTAEVLVNVNPVITFNEPVYKTDGTDITGTDLLTLVTFKKTDASGVDVPFTAAIDAAKKVITITPSSALSNSQAYYLAVGAVKDASANQSTPSSITFTTIAAATPTLTLTYPVGGETVYAGDPVSFTWTSANISNINIEVWVPNDVTRVYYWLTLASNVSATAGKYDFTIPTDAYYGTEYKIRLSDASNSAVNSVSNAFTLIAYANSILNLRENNIVNDIVRLSSEVVMSFKRATGNQKYIQDAGSGLLIYDPSAVLTTPLNVGDKFTGLEGKLATYGGVLEIVPTKASVTVTSTGNTITAPELSLTEYFTNYATYESRLITLKDVHFPDATGAETFAAATNYNLSDFENVITFRTFAAGESDIIGWTIPVSHVKMTCIAGFYTTSTTTVQVYARTKNDFEFITTAEKVSSDAPVIYPVPAKEVLTIRNLSDIRKAEILDASGRVIRSENPNGGTELSIPVGNLAKGIYFLRLTTQTGRVTSKFIK
jgi:hypothetical protein